MLIQNNIEVELHDFDTKGNCFADIELLSSKTRIEGFKVMQALNGGVLVYMPSWMHTNWTCSDVAWSEVRFAIADEYKRIRKTKQNDDQSISNEIIVIIHDFDSNDNCLADIELSSSEIRIEGFRVKPGLGSGVLVHMPTWMHTHWSYSNIQWREVRIAISNEYTKQRMNNQIKRGLPKNDYSNGICSFHSLSIRDHWLVDIELLNTGEKIVGLQLSYWQGHIDRIQLFMPKEMNNIWSVESIEWEEIKGIVLNEFCEKRPLAEEFCQLEGIVVHFYQKKRLTTCVADIKLSHKKNVIKGFRIKKIHEDDRIIVSLPNWIDRWKDNIISWYDLCDRITNEFKIYLSKADQSCEDNSLSVNNNEKESQERETVISGESASLKQPKEKNEFGRIKNAENVAFRFYPKTVLRIEPQSEERRNMHTRQLSQLVVALNSGPPSGFGPFEIGLLEWINQLRYVNSTMLLDLIKAGYVSFGWRDGIIQSKLKSILDRMSKYNLIEFSRFKTINDDGTVSSDGTTSVMRITTMGINGSNLLHEIGKSAKRFNAFDIYQDGNTVKRYLAANQWLIFLLKTYKDKIGENYSTHFVVHQKGAKYEGARLYATVTVDDCTLIAEPVRRVEDFEIEKEKQRLRQKTIRLIELFDNQDQLYHGIEEISFPQRPIIVFVCEDDDHIADTWKTIKSVLPEDGRQIVWFTQDLKTFNDDEEERFISFEGDKPQIIDIDAYFE